MAKKPKTAEEEKKKKAYYSKTEKKAKAVKKQLHSAGTLADTVCRERHRSLLILLFLVALLFWTLSHLECKGDGSSGIRHGRHGS